MPEGIPPDAVCIVDRITPELIQEEIKKTIRHLDISASDFNINLIRGWEKEYDTNIDETNIHMFIYDRFTEPIKYLHILKEKCIKSHHIQELKQENIILSSALHPTRAKK